MKETLLAVAKGIVGGAAAILGMSAVNQRIEQRATIPRVLSGTEAEWAWQHGTIRYTVAGPEGAPPLLLLHGIYATAHGWEMRRVHNALADRYRVYTPDLLGFGRSDHPPLDYDDDLYIQLITDLAVQVIGGKAAVIASTLTCSHLIAAAARRSDLFGPLVLIEPVGLQQLARKTGLLGDAVYTLVKSPVVGEFLFNLLASRASIRWYLTRQAYVDPTLVTEEVLDANYAAAHQPNARFAPGAFVAGRFNRNIRHDLAQLRQPILLTWGYKSTIVPVQQATEFMKVAPRAEIIGFDAAGLPHDETATEFVAEVAGWLRDHWPTG